MENIKLQKKLRKKVGCRNMAARKEELIILNGVPFIRLLFSIRLIEFFQIWPLQQWITSLVGLVVMYWLATEVYNKRLVKVDLGMSIQFRFWMILSDLLLNLVLGLYYLGYRETVMGQLMLKCPIAVSPVIFVIELILLIIIKEYAIYKISSTSKANKKT